MFHPTRKSTKESSMKSKQQGVIAIGILFALIAGAFMAPVVVHEVSPGVEKHGRQ